MTDVLDLIDGAISDWETSPDAMRWSAEPPAEEPEFKQGGFGGGAVYVAPVGSPWVDAGWQSLGWCEESDLELAWTPEPVMHSWDAVRTIVSSATFTVRFPIKSISPPLFRTMWGTRHPKLRDMHCAYARRVRARRRRSRRR